MQPFVFVRRANILGIYQSRAQLFLLLHPANPGSHIELNGSHLFCASKPPHKLHCLDIKAIALGCKYSLISNKHGKEVCIRDARAEAFFCW